MKTLTEYMANEVRWYFCCDENFGISANMVKAHALTKSTTIKNCTIYIYSIPHFFVEWRSIASCARLYS